MGKRIQGKVHWYDTKIIYNYYKVGVLITNKLDDGKGKARGKLFRHKHEVICGKTSSISHQILGFDEEGNPTNYDNFGQNSWEQIVKCSKKIINFYDMGGSTKFFKTTTNTLTSNYFNYLFLIIGADKGINQQTDSLINIGISS